MTDFIRPKPPYLGAAYYPEDWPLEQIDDEIRLMKQAGMNVMRIAEFAWSKMEPEEGRFDFDWLHLVVEKLGDAGIATIMGTPTATPPAWLTYAHPEILFIKPDGTPYSHGQRRHYCPNNETYREFCRKIVTKMAEEFGRDERVIGWQIDNELFSPNFPITSCACPVCRQKFSDYMRKRFGTIQALNDAWCTNLWSQTYQDFSQLPYPKPGEWHHPSLLTAWREFASDSYIEFCNIQADILHNLTDQPVGTDMMMIVGLDHYKTNEKLDVVQYNHYHYREALWESIFWFDYIRPIKDVPFWNTETSTSWSGSVATSGYSEPGFCRANSWLPVALGGEANLYWLWRTHRAGQELTHGSVLSTCGRPMHTFREVQEVAEGYQKAADFINGTTPVNAGFAMHFSNFAHLMFTDQPIKNGFDYLRAFLDRAYGPLMRAQFRPDVINPTVDLSAYKVIFTPFLPALDEAGLRERITEWIEAGGTWIAGPFTDIRTTDGTKFTHAPYGSLEDIGGVYCKFDIPGEPRDFAIHFNDGTQSKGSIWYDALEPRDSQALATYTEGPMAGLAAVTSRKLGKGRVVVLGTMPQPEDLVRLFSQITSEAGVLPAAKASENVVAVPRKGEAGEGLMVVEFDNKGGWIELDREMTNLLTGQRLSGMIELPPYGVMVLKQD